MAELTDTQGARIDDALPENTALLTLAQRLQVCACSVRPGYAADHRNCDRRVEAVAAVVREHVTAALDEIERRIASSISPNFALRHDGTEDPQAAAYVEGLHDAHAIVRGYRQEQDR